MYLHKIIYIYVYGSKLFICGTTLEEYYYYEFYLFNLYIFVKFETSMFIGLGYVFYGTLEIEP